MRTNTTLLNPDAGAKPSSSSALWGYFLATFGFSWGIWAIPVAMRLALIPSPSPRGLELLTLGTMVLGAFGPMFGALTMSHREGGGAAAMAHLKRVVKVKGPLRWYLIPVALLVPLVLVARTFSRLLGAEPLASYLPTPWLIPAYLIFLAYFGGGQEEIGWRGYALDRLLNRHNEVVASLILGAAWGLWHAPLWFMTGSPQVFMPFPAFVLELISLSVIMTWIYVGSGRSMFVAMWTHALSNSLKAILPVFILEKAPQNRYWVYCGCLTILAVIVALARGLRRRSGDIR